MTIELHGHVLIPQGFVRGQLRVDAGRIAVLQGTPVTEAEVRADSSTPILLPGFIDLHIHGGGGADTMDAGTAAATIARQHARTHATAQRRCWPRR